MGIKKWLCDPKIKANWLTKFGAQNAIKTSRINRNVFIQSKARQSVTKSQRPSTMSWK